MTEFNAKLARITRATGVQILGIVQGPGRLRVDPIISVPFNAEDWRAGVIA